MSMKAGDLIRSIEKFHDKLLEHRDLWAESLDRSAPILPERNLVELQEQCRSLGRMLGSIRPYLQRFRSTWLAERGGVEFDTLDAAVGIEQLAPIKGPSLQYVINGLNQTLGALQTLAPDDVVPESASKPIRAEHAIAGYLDKLHPSVGKASSELFRDSHYPEAVEAAFKSVLQYLRDQTGLTLDGADLINVTFGTGSPKLTFGDLDDPSVRNEQVGFMEILKGFWKGVRHPLAHRQGKEEDVQKAFEYLVSASLLCRRIDDAVDSSKAGEQ